MGGLSGPESGSPVWAKNRASPVVHVALGDARAARCGVALDEDAWRLPVGLTGAPAGGVFCPDCPRPGVGDGWHEQPD